MMPNPDEFARAWSEAWNAHDLERILAHYTDDFDFTSPYIVRLMGEPTGALKGKDRIREYWRRGLERLPDLHFKHVSTCAGVDSIAIHYQGAEGKQAIEVFFFAPDGRVARAAAHYAN